MTGRFCGRSSAPGMEVSIPKAGGQGDEQAAGSERRDERAAQDAVEDRAPDPALAVLAAQPRDERDVAKLDLVAELREERRQDGQRADDGHGDDEDRGDGDAGEGAGAREEHAGHGDHDRQAGDEDSAARGRGGGLERGLLALAGGPLLALALEVEERVIHSDGEADQEHDRVGGVVDVEGLVVAPVDPLPHAVSTLPVYVHWKGVAVWL